MSKLNDILIRAGRGPLSLPDATDRLKTSLAEYVSQKTNDTGNERLVTFSAELEKIDELTWLQNQSVFPRIFWMNRDRDDVAAGIGKADSIVYDEEGPNSESFLFLQRNLDRKPHGERYFGGCSFNNQQKKEKDWDPFHSLCFILPQVQICRNNDGSQLKAHLYIPEGADPEEASSGLQKTLDSISLSTTCSASVLPDTDDISYKPAREKWIETCTAVLNTFREGFMGKIILARQTHLTFRTPFSPLLFLLNYPFPESSTYRYYFEPEKNRAFFSFTPERLYLRNHDSLMTEALAGTCSKDTLPDGNIDACRHLLNSEKDIREHRFVRDTIASELGPICSEIDMEENVRALQLNNLVHLYTRFRAILKPGSENDATVLTSLHPTPAVGGVPREQALEQIIDLEPFSRGWYAGPVGWISKERAEFAVGIRSALANNRHVFLYSGAGLVNGSSPAAEWDEVEQKIGDMLAITRQTV
ncbi:isochorismate synthase MenF [Prosthecochloris sp. HL-130-GSB]|jgi:menaquinone-specific isochorismate synthase|uniref:isochorismate synthase n=1 Tax=Prosthecochloris sp. HL-130-GSB TaxID=1974213 RepID=UPI000A1C0C07|nr:isochorismate synthase [Prosthecochloris sp. HL-130-GSB]ARM31478.1 isochorismate synthase [Prosthecochloris sp. HL-130-GSB]MBO8092852.1 isochorismate synthase [Prosthecochloris sp.]